jgi:hypothetical protein
MSFNLDGSNNSSNSNSNIKCNTISSLTDNKVTFNDNINLFNSKKILFNNVEVLSSSTLSNINFIKPLNGTLVIDNEINDTQLYINHTSKPGLRIDTRNSSIPYWYGLQVGGLDSDANFVAGVIDDGISKKVMIGGHNDAGNAWVDLYCQGDGKFNVGVGSNVEKLNVFGNIRCDNSGSFYKGTIDQFRFKKSDMIGGSTISITSTSYVLLSQIVYLGTNFSGLISKIYVSANPNGNNLSFKVIDEVNLNTICERTAITGTINLYDLLTISNLLSGGTVLGLYGKVNTGTSYWSSMMVLYDY